eukprot:m.2987 g.2987  ORF g.2987 m.2987 type:complete len:143 (-) comp2640_c0_seq1:1697-2125(-)
MGRKDSAFHTPLNPRHNHKTPEQSNEQPQPINTDRTVETVPEKLKDIVSSQAQLSTTTSEQEKLQKNPLSIGLVGDSKNVSNSKANADKDVKILTFQSKSEALLENITHNSKILLQALAKQTSLNVDQAHYSQYTLYYLHIY